MQKFFIATLFAIALPFSANAQTVSYDKLPAGTYSLDKSHASITWKVKHLGLSAYTARFTKFDAKVNLNPTEITKSSVTVDIDPTSIRTDYPYKEKKDFDKKLVTNKDWFNATAFPKISFKSTSIEKISDTEGKVNGELTFLGVTKPVILNAKFNGGLVKQPFAGVPALGISATAKIKRSDWGFKTYVPNIADEVSILIEAEFLKK